MFSLLNIYRLQPLAARKLAALFSIELSFYSLKKNSRYRPELSIFILANILGVHTGRHNMRRDRSPGGTTSPAPAPAGSAHPSPHSPVPRQEQTQRRRQDLNAERSQGISDRIRAAGD